MSNDDDYYSQPGDLFRPDVRRRSATDVSENTARAMGDAELFIKQRHVRNCYKAGSGLWHVRSQSFLGLDLDEALKATR